MKKSLFLIFALIIIFFTGCELEEITGIPPGLKIKILQGNNQLGSAGNTLRTPLIVLVLNEKDQPVPGVGVEFRISNSNSGSVSPISVPTDSIGSAKAEWTLGTGDVEQMLIVEATLSSGEVATATFTAKVLNSGFVCGDSTWLDIRDGRKYKTIQIGDQCWMAENLNFGDSIKADILSEPTDNQTQKYCPGDLDNNCNIYGGLYTFDEIFGQETDRMLDNPRVGTGPKGICPEGWHLPNLSEQLELYESIQQIFNTTLELPIIRPDFIFADKDDMAGKILHIATDSINKNFRLFSWNYFWLASLEGDNLIYIGIREFPVDTIEFSNTSTNYITSNRACSVRCVKD